MDHISEIVGGPKKDVVEKSYIERKKINLSVKSADGISTVEIEITRLLKQDGIWGFDGIVHKKDGSKAIGTGVLSLGQENTVKHGYIFIQ